MKLVIVHYHLRPGGIRRVIELAAPHLVKQFGNIQSLTLACGEANDEKWNQNFTHLIKPTRLEWLIDSALGYFSEQKKSPETVQTEIAAALRQLLATANASNCVVWAHNLGIGRNLLLTRELACACAARGIPLISHHHDWWFDNRWLRWPEIRRTGFPTLAKVAETIFPNAPTVRHAAINHEEARILAQHLPKTSAWLPNLTTRRQAPAPRRLRFAKQWLQRRLGATPAPVWILPCRLLRRKNVAEALLLAR